jgi:hypothetical protein
METPRPDSYERQLQALGRLLDQRGTPIKELCLVQHRDGFLAQFLEAGLANDSAYVASTMVQYEGHEIAGALADHADRAGWRWRLGARPLGR